MKDAAYKRALHRLRQWVFLEAIPVWSRYGVDLKRGAALDHLGCGPLDETLSPHWVANQARVAYAFAQAGSVFDAPNFDRLDLEIFHFVSRDAVRPWRSDGYVHSLDGQWRVHDQRYYLADHCWFILASLAAHKAFGRSCHLRRAINIAKWLARVFREPDGTFRNCSEAPGRISVKGQLALVEASLALYEATRRQQYLTEAFIVSDTLAQQFLPKTPGEPDRAAGAAMDAEFEYLWLLYKWQCLCPSRTIDNLIRRLRGRIKHVFNKGVAASCARAPLKSLCRTVKLNRANSAAAQACLMEILARVSDVCPAEEFVYLGGRVAPLCAEDLFELVRIFEPVAPHELRMPSVASG